MPDHTKPGKEEKNNQKFVSEPRVDEPNTPHGHSDKIRQWDAKIDNKNDYAK